MTPIKDLPQSEYIAALEAELKAVRSERDMYRTLAEQRSARDASEIEHARNWLEFLRLIQKTRVGE